MLLSFQANVFALVSLFVFNVCLLSSAHPSVPSSPFFLSLSLSLCVFPRQSPSFLLHIKLARACLMRHSSISCPLSVDEFHVLVSTLMSCRRNTINLPLDLTPKNSSPNRLRLVSKPTGEFMWKLLFFIQKLREVSFLQVVYLLQMRYTI